MRLHNFTAEQARLDSHAANEKSDSKFFLDYTGVKIAILESIKKGKYNATIWLPDNGKTNQYIIVKLNEEGFHVDIIGGAYMFEPEQEKKENHFPVFISWQKIKVIK